MCERISDQKSKDECKDDCHRSIAQKKQDADLCEKIVDQNKKNTCYKNIAIAKSDPEICEKIVDRFAFFEKDGCYLEIII